MNYKRPQDFDNPVDYEVYLFCILMNKLNPGVALGPAYETTHQFLEFYLDQEGLIDAEHILEFAEELVNGGGGEWGTTH